MAHTPGPWHFTVTPKDGCFVVDQWGHNVLYGLPEAEANARLIAAAPELLAALRELTRAWDSSTLPVSDRMEAALRDADAAIAKAEGRS